MRGEGGTALNPLPDERNQRTQAPPKLPRANIFQADFHSKLNDCQCPLMPLRCRFVSPSQPQHQILSPPRPRDLQPDR